MDAVERAVPTPQIEIIVQGRAWRQVFRDRAPLAARAQDVHQTVGDLAQVHRALITAQLGRRDMQLDQCPFRIGQVARIAQPATVIASTVFDRPHRGGSPRIRPPLLNHKRFIRFNMFSDRHSGSATFNRSRPILPRAEKLVLVGRCLKAKGVLFKQQSIKPF
jgi:hypothetical protein